MLGDVVAVVGIGLDRLLGMGLKLRCMAEGLSSVELLALDWCEGDGSLCVLHQYMRRTFRCLYLPKWHWRWRPAACRKRSLHPRNDALVLFGVCIAALIKRVLVKRHGANASKQGNSRKRREKRKVLLNKKTKFYLCNRLLIRIQYILALALCFYVTRGPDAKRLFEQNKVLCSSISLWIGPAAAVAVGLRTVSGAQGLFQGEQWIYRCEIEP